jgi:RNase adapter protein RapZ
LRRFNTPRRRHPLSTFGRRVPAPAVLDGIHRERELLVPLRALATAVIDSTSLSIHDLRRQVTAMFGPGTEGGEARMSARIESFGFKYGLPVDADLVLDVRFLKNPHFEPDLQPLSGLDEPVRAYVLENPETKAWLDRVLPYLEFCLPRFEQEGKSYLTVAVGCTGGRHRSVALSEYLAAELAGRLGLTLRAVIKNRIRPGKFSRSSIFLSSNFPVKICAEHANIDCSQSSTKSKKRK